MSLFGSRRWTRQPPSGFADINPALPNPFAVFRTLSDRQQIFPGPVNSSSTWTGVGHRSHGTELGMYMSGGGVMHTLAAQPDRQVYAMALRFQQLTTATTQTIFGINGADNGTQVRINTSEQLELLSEGSALLQTSTTAPFGSTSAVHTLVVVCPTSSGSTYFYLNGKLLMAYAGAVDNKISFKYITFGRRGNSGETLTGVIFDAVMWSGAGNVPTLGQAQEISSQDYYGAIYAPRRARKLFLNSAGGGPATYNVDLTESTSATDALTLIATYGRSVTESASATDTVASTATWPRSVTEAASATDVVAAVRTMGATVAETVTASDIVSAVLLAAAAIAEAASATDASTSSLNGNIYSASLTESATPTDTVAAVAQLVAQIAEAASASDVVARTASLVALLTETGSASDTVSVPGGYSVSITEAATAMDLIVGTLAGVVTNSAAPHGHGPELARRLGALMGARRGSMLRTR